ncbi:MAG: PQQ-dependent sugar dehydrogenase [Bryobacterales bacterium]|nr:PQQ-dependent sugar dehydrogenase [Bryobacterales bacterium]
MHSRNKLVLGFLLAAGIAAAATPPRCDPDNGGITLPTGFCALVAIDNIGAARHLVAAPNDDVYVALQAERNGGGGVVALRSSKGDGHFDVKEAFGEGSSTGIALHNGYLYVAETQSIVRYKMIPGQLKPSGAPEVIVMGLPGEREHIDKGIAFDGKGSLYINVGAPSNACQVKDRQLKSPGQDPCPILEKHGGIWKFNENKLGQTQEDGERFATGLRQMPAITWHNGALYIAMNNRDQLNVLWPGKFTAEENAVRPAEPLYRAVQGSNFGWPFCFYDYGEKKFLTNPEYGGDGKTADRCSSFTPPIAAFPAHWAPVDIMFYSGKEFPKKYQGGAFIAFHGSWNRAPMPQDGYNVTFQPFSGANPSGNFEVFASGFPGKAPLMNPADAVARPDGVAQAPDGSLYITDSQKGKIWHVYYRGK